MAWTNRSIYARQIPEGYWSSGSNYHFRWWDTFRLMRGTVQMRLTDVSSNDYYWGMNGAAKVYTRLRNSAGSILGSVNLYKNWGVQPAFATITYVSGQQSCQLGTSVDLGTDNPPYGYVDWTADLRWDNASPV